MLTNNSLCLPAKYSLQFLQITHSNHPSGRVVWYWPENKIRRICILLLKGIFAHLLEYNEQE